MFFLFTEGASSMEYLDPMLIAHELAQIGTDAEEQYGLSKRSIIWKLLKSIENNNTLSLHDRAASETGTYRWDKFNNNSNHREHEKSNQKGNVSRIGTSTVKIRRNNDFVKTHSGHIRSRYSQSMSER